MSESAGPGGVESVERERETLSSLSNLAQIAPSPHRPSLKTGEALARRLAA